MKKAKATTSNITVRFPKEVFEAVKKAAQKENRSVNNQIVFSVARDLGLKK